MSPRKVRRSARRKSPAAESTRKQSASGSKRSGSKRRAAAQEAGAGGAQAFEPTPKFPVVGIGASAGGLEAFTQLLRALPADTGMAFVLVQHLSPAHESILAEILSRSTAMPVSEVTDELEIVPNRVYAIPPNRNMVLADGRFRLLERDPRAVQHPIDRFFRSLAQHQRHLAIGIVLSGTANDGTLGCEEIKAEGGITFAQDDTAQHSGMPQSAEASGCVDFVLSPGAIAAEIRRIASHPYLEVRESDGVDAPIEDKQAMVPILQLIRATTHVDFAHYKPNTLARRIRRRMVLLRQKSLSDYLHFLRRNPLEAEALYKDILINVTGFFRDAAVFKALEEEIIPRLLKQRGRQDPLRLWVIGCSTGEEAYSLAMLVTEAFDRINEHPLVQIFATDLNASAVDVARAGVYARDRMRDVSRERQRRFFVEADGRYRVAKPLRDMCVFSRHNVASDPPFSRMDLVSCRNLLIYLEPVLQQRILPTIHYALNPTGCLLLGSSETVGPFREFFTALDAKHKIFVKKPGVSPGLFPPPRPHSSFTSYPIPTGKPQSDSGARRAQPALNTVDVQKEADRMLVAFAPPSVLVNASFDVLQIRGDTEPYLVPAQGKASHSLFKMTREGLLVPLQALLRKAKHANARVRDDRVRVTRGGKRIGVAVEVVPVQGWEQEGCFLILFHPQSLVEIARGKAAKRGSRRSKKSASETELTESAQLAQELAVTREYLQGVIEEHEASSEELQSANEEAQSANEELQSINEELETSKEEIQSSNEELMTLNEELHSRNTELGQANSDLANLINSVNVAIVIVGRDFRIRRFSPMAEKLLNIIPADVGRSIADNRLAMLVPDLESLMGQTIDTISALEREVQDRDGHWYLLRIRPYLSLENKLDGAVLMLVDIDALRHARNYAESVIASVRDPLLILDGDLRVRTANVAFLRTFGVTAAEIEGALLEELDNGQWRIPDLHSLLEDVIRSGTTVDGYVVEHEFDHIGRKVMRLDARTIVVPGGESDSILLMIEDITELARSQAEMQHSVRRFRRLFETSQDGVLILDPRTRCVVDANPIMLNMLETTHEDLMHKQLHEIGLLADEAAGLDLFRVLGERRSWHDKQLVIRGPSGVRREIEMISNLYVEDDGEFVQCNVRDITQRRAAEAALHASERKFVSESTALARLNELSSNLWQMQNLQKGLEETLSAAIELVGADFGNIQLYDAERGVLVIAVQRGFDGAFLERFMTVSSKDESACGRALRARERVVIEDTESEETFAQFREIARMIGFRAVQSTPLFGRNGSPLGMLSTHFKRPHRPNSQELRRLDLYVRQAADFIERCRLEEELKARVEELAAADKGKNNFLSVLSHELRTPLSAIRGWVDILKHSNLDPDKLRQAISVIDRQSRAQAELISDLMDVQRLASGKVRLDTRDVDLSAIVASSLQAALPTATEKRIRLRADVEPGPTVVLGDETRLLQVLSNLLSNAIKFSHPDGEVVVTLRRVGAGAELRITDTGDGISRESLPQLFQRFRQGDPSTSRGHGGLGLGLSIVKQLAELHGGSIRAESAGKGQGATFTIVLPLRTSGTRAESKVLSEPPVPEAVPSMGGIKVLIVDDEVDAREPLREALEHVGAEVIAVNSANEALDVIQRQHPDVIVSDIGMPERDGYALVRAVRDLRSERDRNIPAIALTAYGSDEDVARALRSGFNLHLTKPADSVTLIHAAAALALERRAHSGEGQGTAGT